MTDKPLKRYLAALVSADVVGYSRLIADDEIVTIRALTACRGIVQAVVEKNAGRIVDFVGDNMLAEFSNTLDAIRGAEQIHLALQEFNGSFPPHRHMQLRIGIHLGDVTTDGQSLYGDGVNIAARLESVADPGGICISDLVYRQIQGKLDFKFVDMGMKMLKNIPEPVKVFKRQSTQSSGLNDGLSTAATPTAPPLPLPAKPSLVVLPFVNLDMNPDQDHFSDGLTMDIITALVQIPSLFLISDLTTFSIKTKPMSIIEIGRRLGVQFVLEGGVRRSGDRLRISARLSETGEGRQLWAQRFDRRMGDIFDIQDEITAEIVTAMDVQLVSGEPARYVRRAIKNTEALEFYYRGWSSMFSSSSEYIQLSRQMFEEMIRLAPDSSLGHAVCAWAYLWGVLKNASMDVDYDLNRVHELVGKARLIGDDTGITDLVMAHLHLLNRDHDKALSAIETAISARPSCDVTFAAKASILTYLGRPEEAIPLARFAIRLSPVYPSYYPVVLGYACYHCGKMAEAREAAEICLAVDSDNLEAMVLSVITNAALEDIEKAREMAERIRQTHPEFSVESFADNRPYRDKKYLAPILSHFQQVIS